MSNLEGSRAALNDKRSQRHEQISGTVDRSPKAIRSKRGNGFRCFFNVSISVPQYGPRNEVDVDEKRPVTIDSVKPNYVANDCASGGAVVDCDGRGHGAWNDAAKADPQLSKLALWIGSDRRVRVYAERTFRIDGALPIKRGYPVQRCEDHSVAARGARRAVKLGALGHDKWRRRRRLFKMMHVRFPLLNVRLLNARSQRNVRKQPFRCQFLDFRGKNLVPGS